MNKFGGRKFVIGLIVLLIGLGVDAFVSGGLSANLLDLLKFVAGGFILGNSAVTVAGIIKDSPKPEETQSVSLANGSRIDFAANAPAEGEALTATSGYVSADLGIGVTTAYSAPMPPDYGPQLDNISYNIAGLEAKLNDITTAVAQMSVNVTTTNQGLSFIITKAGFDK